MFSLEGIDHGLLYGLNQGRHPWLSNIMITLSQISGNYLVFMATLAVAFYCAFYPKLRFKALLYPVATFTGFLTIECIKRLVERDRPNIVPWLVSEQTVHGFSFPSGHATNNTLLGILILALILQMELRLPVKIALASLMIAWALTIGFSRIYLGVHWPTDVLGGWCLGGIIGLGWLKLISILEQSKKPPTQPKLPN